MRSVRVAVDDLKRCVASAFGSAGATEADAECVASSLVASDLARTRVTRGHPGVSIPGGDRPQGSIDPPKGQPELTGDDGATARIDGHAGFGQVAGRFAIDVAIRKARAHGVSSVALARTNHVGRLD